jgi:hypothetical protein
VPEAPARGYGYRTRDDSRGRLGVPPDALTQEDLRNGVIGNATDSSGSSGSVASTATISLTTTGLLFLDRFNRADAGTWGTDWTIVTAGTASIVSNVGRFVVACIGCRRCIVASIMAARGEQVVQAYHRFNVNQQYPGIRARWNGADDGAGNSSYWLQFGYDGVVMFKSIGGADTVLATLLFSPNAAPNTLYGTKLHVKDNFQKSWIDGRVIGQAADAALNGVNGKAGLRMYGNTSLTDYSEIEDFAVYASNTVTVTGLQAGYQVRLNGTLFPQVAGVATCDLTGAMCPLQSIEVLDDTNSVVATLIPSAGVWGGDVYAYNPVGQLNGLTATPATTSVRLDWPAIEDATGYKIEGHAGDGVWTTLGTTSATTFTQTGLTEGTARYYRVTAVKNGLEGQPSGSLSVTTLPIPPTDLHTSSEASGAVVFVWSDLSSKETAYQLQRAPGVNGTAFVDVMTPTAANATTKTDTSALAGQSYRYRLAAIDVIGQRSYSNQVAVTLADIGVNITLSGTGLLFSDDFTRANGAPGANYTVESGTWAIDTNRLKVTGGVSSQIKVAAVAARKKSHIQALIRKEAANDYAILVTRRSGTNLYLFDVGAGNDGTDPNKSRLYRETGGVYTRLDGGLAPAGYAIATFFRHTFSTITGALKGWINGVLAAQSADATVANDINGDIVLSYAPQGGNGDAFFDELIICSDRPVQLVGLPAGYKLKIAGQLSALSDGVNPVSCDILGAQMPIASLEVVDVAGNTIRTLAPGGGIYGGDVYAIDGAAVPPPPPPTPPTSVDIGIGPPGVFDGVTVGITNYNSGTDGVSGQQVIVSHPLTGTWRGSPASVAQDISFSSAVVEVRVQIGMADFSALPGGVTLEAYDNLGALLGSTTTGAIPAGVFTVIGVLTFAGIRTVRVVPPAGKVLELYDILFKH